MWNIFGNVISLLNHKRAEWQNNTSSASTLGIYWMLDHSVVCDCFEGLCSSKRAPNRAEQEEELEGFHKQKHIGGARGKRDNPSGVSSTPPQITKHQSIPQRLESLLISAAGSGSLRIRWVEQGRSSQGGKKEMNDCRREMDGAMKRGQALIDPGGRDVWVLRGKKGEEGCIKTLCVQQWFIQLFHHVHVLTWRKL